MRRLCAEEKYVDEKKHLGLEGNWEHVLWGRGREPPSNIDFIPRAPVRLSFEDKEFERPKKKVPPFNAAP